MTIYDQIHGFAREFISDKRTRTTRRKSIIIKAYKQLSGKSINITCSTCYIEALLFIINNTQMATTNYRLKKGYIAQFDIPYKGIKAFTNDQMTDEIAKEYLKQYPSRIIYFEKTPGPVTVMPKTKGMVTLGGQKEDKAPETEVIPAAKEGKTAEQEIADLKASLDALNVKYHPKTGVVKLRKLLDEALNTVE